MMQKQARADLKAAAELARNPYAWPGGYPRFAITSDGGALAPATVRDEWRNIVGAHLANDKRGGWYIVAADINWEDADLVDDHTGKRIESAYAED